MALVRAVQNVKSYYAVVGVTERYTQFLEVLEHILPTYFRGASKVYHLQGKLGRVSDSASKFQFRCNEYINILPLT